MTNVSLLDENISVISPRNLTASPAPMKASNNSNSKRRSSEKQRYNEVNGEELGDYGYNDKDTRAGTTSLKSQESVSPFHMVVVIY
jgi:hypothetical protein